MMAMGSALAPARANIDKEYFNDLALDSTDLCQQLRQDTWLVSSCISEIKKPSKLLHTIYFYYHRFIEF